MRVRTILLLLLAVSLSVSFGNEPAVAVELTGTSADEVLFGGSAADRLDGGRGNDVLFAKATPPSQMRQGRRVTPKDKLVGRSDFDTFEADTLVGGSGRDVMSGGIGLAVDDDGTDGDSIESSTPGLTFAADGGRDTIRCETPEGKQGAGFVFADLADDVRGCSIVVRQTAGYISSIPGAIIFIPSMGTNDPDSVTGSEYGGTGTPILFGRGGEDSLILEVGGWALGGADPDRIQGSNSLDALFDADGTPGDELNGGGGADRIFAADGAPGIVDCGLNDSAEDTVYADAYPDPDPRPDDVLINCENDTVFAGDNEIVS